MTRINWKRLFLCGLLAGLVVNACEAFVSGVILMDAWAEAMKALNRSAEFSAGAIASFNLWGFIMGFSAVWLYVEVRDRYGPGIRSAVCAAVAVWVMGYLSGMITAAAMEFFPIRLLVVSTLFGLVEIVLATVVGAYLYRPAAEP